MYDKGRTAWARILYELGRTAGGGESEKRQDTGEGKRERDAEGSHDEL